MAKARHTVLVWLVVLVSFVGFYAASSSDHVGLAFAIAIALLVLLFIAVIVSAVQRTRRFNVDNNAGVTALSRGSFADAEAVFQRWAQSSDPRIHMVATFNLAATVLRAGDPARALALVAGSPQPAHVVLARLLAALDGSPEAPATPPAVDPNLYPYVLLTRMIRTLRSGDPSSAIALFDADRTSIELGARGDVIRVLRVVRAFAHAQDIREAGNVEASLRDLKPLYPREYTFLGARWPEMAAFLTAHSLV